MGFFDRFTKGKKETLDKGLEKTKENFFSKITRAVAGKSKVDDDVLDNLEEILVTSDVGVDTTLKIIERIEERVARDKYVGTDELTAMLRDEIALLLTENNSDDLSEFTLPEGKKPYVIMVVGVTGVGKTTTLVKLVSSCIFERGAKVGIINADVFRVGAQDQLGTYATILDVPVTTIYDSREIVEAMAAFSGLDFVFIDTSGKAPQDKAYQAELSRLSTLGDIQETYLTVSSATSGRVCRQIVKEYENIGPYRVVVTKLDESGSYGAAVNLCQASGQPLSYVTTGQNVPEDICRARVDEIIASLLR